MCVIEQVNVRLVSVDLKTIVQGRELVSLQLLDSRLNLDMAPTPSPQLRTDSMSLKLQITNINILDLQVTIFVSPPPYDGDQDQAMSLGHTFTLHMLQASEILGTNKVPTMCLYRRRSHSHFHESAYLKTRHEGLLDMCFQRYIILEVRQLNNIRADLAGQA